MSGFCAFPATERVRNGVVEPVPPEYSHERCLLSGCPCSCHLGEEYECGCGRTIREAPLLTNDEAPDEMVYVHVDRETGRSIGEECP
jgi:hypothetical protein